MLENIMLISLSYIAAVVYAMHVAHYSLKLVTFRNSIVVVYSVAFLLSILLCVFSYSLIPYPIIYSAAYIAFLIFYFICFKGKTLVFLFAAGNFIFHLLCLKGIIFTIYSMVMQITMYDAIHIYSHHSITSTLQFSLATVFLFAFRKVYTEDSISLLLNRENQLKMITRIQFILNVTLVVATITYNNNSLNDWIVIYHFMLSIMIILGFYILFKYTVSICIQEEYELKTEMLEYQVKVQLEQYNVQTNYIKDLRRLKHDYSNQIKGLHYLLAAGEANQAQEYIKELDSEMVNLNVNYHQYSNHVLIDAILQDIKTRLEKVGGRVEGYLNITDLPLSELQICTIFSNVFNNALEACIRMKSKQRFIYLESAEEGSWTIIKIENSYNGVVVRENGKLKTLKKNQIQHGLGIETVTKIMETVQGSIELREDQVKKVFKVILLFPNHG